MSKEDEARESRASPFVDRAVVVTQRMTCTLMPELKLQRAIINQADRSIEAILECKEISDPTTDSSIIGLFRRECDRVEIQNLLDRRLRIIFILCIEIQSIYTLI